MPSASSQSNGVKVLACQGRAAAQACCHSCGHKATLFVSQVSAAGQVTSQSFCLIHALKAGLLHPKAWDLLDTGRALQQSQPEKACRCGVTESLLKHKGRAGCSQCYRIFAHLFVPLLPKLHSGTVHAGKRPRTARPIPNVRRRVEVLKIALERAIRAEAYEQAAQVRQELNELTK